MVTLAQFFTEPEIVPDFEPQRPQPRRSLASVAPEPFMGLSAKVGPNGAQVWDGDRLVASIGRLDHLVVLPEYRGRGIATALVKLWYQRNPGFRPKRIAKRTALGAEVYARAWREMSNV